MRRIGWAGPALLLAVGGFLALGPSSEGLRWRPEHLAPLLRGGPGPVALLLLGLLAPFPLAAWARGRFDGRADRVGACLGVALAAQALAFAAAVRFGTAGYLAACLATAAAGVGLGFERGRWRSAFADYGLAVGPLVLFGLLSAGLGQDTDFDFHNYHYYNGHSLAEGRLGADLAVGNLEGAFNPLMDTAAYLLSRLVPPPWFGFTLGALHGAAFVLLALLAREALAGAGVVENRARLAVACAAAGVVEPMFLTQLGTWFHEDLLAVFALAAAWLVARRLGNPAKLWRGALAAGLLVGAAAGLKLTAAAVALGLGAAIGAAAPGIANRARSLAAWGAGALAGFLLADGFWMARLWDRYRNPVFPFFNGLFRSPYWPAESFDFLRPMPWHEHLALPFHLALSGDPVGQFGTRDPRLALVATLAIAGVLLAAWHAWRRRRDPEAGGSVGWVATRLSRHRRRGEAGSRPGLQETLQSTAGGSLPPPPAVPLFVLVLTLTTYLLWHAKFRVLRYLVVVKLLAPLAAVLLVLAILGPTRRARLAAGLVLVACVAGIAVPDYGHGPWGDRLVSQTIPPPTGLGRAVVLIVSTPEGGGYLPLAAVPTAFPRGVRFADLTSHLCLLTRPTPTGPVPLRMREDVAALLDRHDGPIHLLTPRRSDPGAIARALGPHWLKPDEAPGNTIPVVVDGFDLLLRPVARIPRTALPCPADFDGDGRADRVVFRADLGWSFPWSPGRRIGGGPARPDLPAPADYDGDRRADPATFDPAEGLWRVPGRDPLSFGQGTLHGGDPLPVPADYDGDRRADPVAFDHASGLWSEALP